MFIPFVVAESTARRKRLRRVLIFSNIYNLIIMITNYSTPADDVFLESNYLRHRIPKTVEEALKMEGI